MLYTPSQFPNVVFVKALHWSKTRQMTLVSSHLLTPLLPLIKRNEWNGFLSKNANGCLLVFYQIAEKVAAPLSRTSEIVILSGDGSRVTGEVNRLLAELPVSINAITGVDLTKVRRGTVQDFIDVSCYLQGHLYTRLTIPGNYNLGCLEYVNLDNKNTEYKAGS